ncbi:MAG TPA: hypothetical protein VLJ21_03745 [Candidatus Binatia bacterium]|nr:hypothetical protein [Candidatus Binatia bacterium]
MKPVDVLFKRAEVLAFDAKTGIVEYRVIINDGKDKAIQRQDKIDDCGKLANDIFTEVRTKMKELHKSNNFDDGPLANVVMVRIAGDEEVLIERLFKFFASIKEKLRNASMRKLSYYDTERQIVGLKTDLT